MRPVYKAELLYVAESTVLGVTWEHGTCNKLTKSRVRDERALIALPALCQTKRTRYSGVTSYGTLAGALLDGTVASPTTGYRDRCPSSTLQVYG